MGGRHTPKCHPLETMMMLAWPLLTSLPMGRQKVLFVNKIQLVKKQGEDSKNAHRQSLNLSGL